jgi:hypothetical protein
MISGKDFLISGCISAYTNIYISKQIEKTMQKGDIVIADNPDSTSRSINRSYGIVHEVNKAGTVIIEMADGSMIKRSFNSIAVYTHPPSNWQELFQQQILFSQPTKKGIYPGSYKGQHHH